LGQTTSDHVYCYGLCFRFFLAPVCYTTTVVSDNSRALVLLFDIDGTLITTGGAGRVAIEQTFFTRYGKKDVFKDISFAGMTDPAILRAGFRALGREPIEGEMIEVLETYVQVLEDVVKAADNYRLHTGIEAALARADQEANCAIGLGTGNIREGARVKLERVGIYHRFAFGGFGSDHEERPELIRIGAERGAQALGRPRRECRVVIIGDTPKDVDAARAIGAESIGVATSAYTKDQLLASGASYAFSDLSEPGAIEALLDRGS
jgi:phosphoglycolate phosphatase-like HAD superfamily hydrolase